MDKVQKLRSRSRKVIYIYIYIPCHRRFFLNGFHFCGPIVMLRLTGQTMQACQTTEELATKYCNMKYLRLENGFKKYWNVSDILEL
jgi:hypothetical protein